MDLEQLRAEIVEGCDRIAAMRLATRRQRALARAQAAYWRQAGTPDLEAVLRFLGQTSAPDVVALSPEEREVAEDAARSMRDRASRVALQNSVIPCHWLANNISAAIDQLPLLENP